jgi:acetylornithine deacetylase/succinyl-diaminopimelate desuccinylase-like protein
MLTRPSADPKRVLARLEELYAIGGEDGANRIGYTGEEDEAHALATAWMSDAGLAVERDGAGNLVGRLPGRERALPEVWSGSHLDTVPRGGRFDGALGVIAALEAVERIGPQARTLGVVVFRDEERGCHGSRALCEAGGSLPGAFVELHIEQGPRLAQAEAPLGIVTGIVGYARRTVRFTGRAGHAGTTPMAGRDDALCAAAAYVLRVQAAARGIADAVATVGTLDVEPGAANVIPGSVRLTVDARAPDGARLDGLLDVLNLDREPRVDPIALDEGVRVAVADEVRAAGLPVVELASGAGHDAGILAAAGVPTGMLFVRSLAGGVSHSPDEHSSAEDIAVAIDVLAATLRSLAS